MFNFKRNNTGRSGKQTRLRSTQRANKQAYYRLEPKLPLTTFVVNTILDSPTGLDDGLVSLREAITAANTNAAFGDAPAGDTDGDRILFADELANSIVTLNQGELSLTDDVLIQAGDLNVTIDAANNSRHFSVTTSERVGFGRLTLVNGFADQGGSISSTGGGTVLIVGSSLSENTADGDGGGAIFNQTGDVHISSDSIFANNLATGASGRGGVILTESGLVAVTGGKLTSNSATLAGGAVAATDGQFYATDVTIGEQENGNSAGTEGASEIGTGGGVHLAGVSTAAISGGSVGYNFASHSGGGLWNSADSQVWIRAGSTVTNNLASGSNIEEGGGGVFNDGGDVFIREATISDNSASGNNGGGILSSGGRVIAIESTIARNRSANNGGGLEISGGLLSLNSAIIEANSAGVSLTANGVGNGGGLHVDGESSSAILHDATFRGNAAPNEGGGIWNQAGSGMFLSGTTAISNNSSGGEGGGLFTAAFVRSIDTTFESNQSADQGGGLYIAEPGAAHVQNGSFSENASENSGGGISNVGFLDLKDSTFVDNTTTTSFGRSKDLATGSSIFQENNVFLPATDIETPTTPEPSDGFFTGLIAEIPVAEDGTTDFYYDAETGSVIVSIGADVLVVDLDGYPFDYDQLNRDTELGEPQLEEESRFAFLESTGLPTGVYDLGSILPADGRIQNNSQFPIRFNEITARSVTVGETETQRSFEILPATTLASSGGIFTGSLADIPTAADRRTDFYYEATTGSVLVSVGAEVLALGLQGYPFDYDRLNRFTALGEPAQEDDVGLGFLAISGLPAGVYDLGPILPANVFIETTAQFNEQFDGLLAQSGAFGESTEPEFIVLSAAEDGTPVIPEAPTSPEVPDVPTTPEPPTTPATPTGIFTGSLADIPTAADRRTDFYYEATTGSVVVSVGQEVLLVGLGGAELNYDRLNRVTDLGEPLQENEDGVGFLHISGLPVGVYDLGPILPANVSVETTAQFNEQFDQLVAQSGALGESTEPEFIVIPATEDGIPVIPEAPTSPEAPDVPTTPEPPTTPATSTGIFAGSLADFPTAADRTADFYYDPLTGSVLVSIGSGLPLFALEGYPFDYDQLNRATDLGEPSQADEEGFGFLNISGLPVGVYDLGPILPADSLISDGSQFINRFDQLITRTIALGEPELRPPFNVLPA